MHLDPRNVVPSMPACGGNITIELTCVHINLRLIGAGEGDRTLVVGLGSLCSTIELHPHNPKGIDALCPLRGVRYPHWARFTDLSCDRSPDGSLHTFVSGRSFHPLSPSLQRGIRFFHLPLPATASDHLAVILVCNPARRHVRLISFRISNRIGKVLPFRR
jgi:hypothetical protein